MNLENFKIFNKPSHQKFWCEGKKFLLLFLVFIDFYLYSILSIYWPIILPIIFWLFVLLMIVLVIRRLDWAMVLFFIELLFCQGGQFFEFHNLSLRTALLFILLLGWLIRKIIKRERIEFFNQPASVGWLLLFMFVALAAFRGYANQHSNILIAHDVLSYSFLLIVFPLSDLIKKENVRQWFIRIVVVAIIGVSVFTLINLFVYSAGLSYVHDAYYWWVRNMAVGKITDLGQGFFRVVLPAHLWFLPAFLLTLALWFNKSLPRQRKNLLLFLAILISLTLLINFSRAYFLGILAGLLLLKIKLPWRQWLICLALVGLVLFIEFNGIYFLTTGQWAGINFLTGRVGTILQPEEELSSLTRLRILPDLLAQIKNNFWLGVGLGETVKYLDPLTGSWQTTTQIDWGWLQILVNLGLVGLLANLFLLGQIIFGLVKKIVAGHYSFFYCGLFLGLFGLMVATLTGPFLFHPLGIFYQMTIISLL